MTNSSLMEQAAKRQGAANLYKQFKPEEWEILRYRWRVWARDNQLAPSGDWLIWLIIAGRGFGKTRSAAEYIRQEVESNRTRYIALVAKTPADARDIMIEGESGILSISPSNFKPLYEPSKRRITWPNGTKALIYSSQEPDQLRGPQFDLAWGDEIRTWYYPQETWDNLMFGLRIGQHPRVVATTTPMPIGLIKKLLKSPDVVVTRGTTYENKANLAPSFYSQIISRYEGTRLGRQEINAELLEDVPGALWSTENIIIKPAPDLIRIVVAIDPAVTSSEGADETGIMVVGTGVDSFYYVLADRSARLSPDGWARRAIQAYIDFKADRIIGEVNNGGEMIEFTLRTIDRNIPYKAVHASRGKQVRAEPIAALYEQCVAEDTQIATEYGNRAIQDIKRGDYVWTRQGLRRVLWSGQTGVSETLELRTANHKLILTANHPVYVEGRGFVNALTLVPKRDIIKVCEIEKSIPVQIAEKKLRNHAGDVCHVQLANGGSHENHYDPSWNSMGDVIINSQINTGVQGAIQEIIYYIEILGKQITGQFLQDVQSIISMAIQAITAYRIWQSCPKVCIRIFTMLASLFHNKKRGNRYVNIAGSPLSVASNTLGFVHLPVIENIGIKSIEPGPKLPVYNLEVEGSPEFFANGVLVHNCKVFHVQAFDELDDQLTTWTPETGKSPDRLDALVWAMTELMPPAPEPTEQILEYDTMSLIGDMDI